MFQKISRQRIFEDLVEQIEHAILTGRLRAGDKLPSQRELVDMFQTSRGTLREALRVLEQKGLIDIRLGVSGGAVVKRINTEPVTESLALLMKHRRVSLTELAEFRQGMEGQIAALAAERASAADIEKMKSLLADASACVEAGADAWPRFCRIDRDLHLVIADACQNSVYRLILRMVQDNIQPYYEAHPLKDHRIMRENFRDLTEIVHAIEQRQNTVVQSLMKSHVRRFNRYMSLQQSAAAPSDAPHGGDAGPTDSPTPPNKGEAQ